MILPIFTAHVSCESFNLTSFSVLSDAGGGDSFDRVVMNEPRVVYMRMYIPGYVEAIVIMTDNDVLQTKFIGYNPNWQIPASFTNNPFHMVIEDVWKNMETSSSDVEMNYNTKIHINNDEYDLWCTWTSTVKPNNVTVELDCEVVKTDGDIITAKCISETAWNKYVFNRLPIYIGTSNAYFGKNSKTNQVLFGKESFSKEGSVKQPWDGSTRYKVSGHESNLTINDQLTIKNLPTDFVSHWVNMRAEAYMGNIWGSVYAMLVPPNDS